MSEARLHVVFGAGQVGRVLAARLAALGGAVRLVSRHRPSAPLDGVVWRGLTQRTSKPLAMGPKAHPSSTNA